MSDEHEITPNPDAPAQTILSTETDSAIVESAEMASDFTSPSSEATPDSTEPAIESSEEAEPQFASVDDVSTDEESAQVSNSDGLPPVNEDEVSDEPEQPVNNKRWYVVKVTSGREESIKAAVERRVKIEGLEEYYGQIVIPVERITVVKKVKETKNGEKITKEKRVTKEQKKFPGYIMAEVEFNDRILYLFRETSGVGDFVGAAGPLKPPPPMTEIEVKRMRGETVKDDGKGAKPVIKLDFEKGDKVRIREGAFANMEGEIKEITLPKDASETPKIKVAVTIFGREVPVDLDYWQVDKI